MVESRFNRGWSRRGFAWLWDAEAQYGQDRRGKVHGNRCRRFFDEYSVDHNAVQTAIWAGYSARSARQTGHRLLTNDDDVAQAVQERTT